MKQQNKPWIHSLNKLGYSVVTPSHCGALKLSGAIAAAFKYDCRFCLCSVCLCGCSHSSSFFFFTPAPPAWIRSRRKEPPSIEVCLPPPSFPAVLMVGLRGTGCMGRERWKTEALICFILQFSKLNPGTLGDRC